MSTNPSVQHLQRVSAAVNSARQHKILSADFCYVPCAYGTSVWDDCGLVRGSTSRFTIGFERGCRLVPTVSENLVLLVLCLLARQVLAMAIVLACG